MASDLASNLEVFGVEENSRGLKRAFPPFDERLHGSYLHQIEGDP